MKVSEGFSELSRRISAALNESERERLMLVRDSILPRIEDGVTHGWIWKGQVKRGYPFVKLNNSQAQVRRLVYEAFSGPLGDRAVRSACADKRCCDPDCLERGPYPKGGYRYQGAERSLAMGAAECAATRQAMPSLYELGQQLLRTISECGDDEAKRAFLAWVHGSVVPKLLEDRAADGSVHLLWQGAMGGLGRSILYVPAAFRAAAGCSLSACVVNVRRLLWVVVTSTPCAGKQLFGCEHSGLCVSPGCVRLGRRTGAITARLDKRTTAALLTQLYSTTAALRQRGLALATDLIDVDEGMSGATLAGASSLVAPDSSTTSNQCEVAEADHIGT
jgi:hypothetical protein